MGYRLRLMFLTINALLIALWLWARVEQQTITVVAEPSGVAAFDQAGKLLASALRAGESGQVGLYIRRRLLPGRVPPLDTPPEPLAWLGRESAWGSLTVVRNSDGAVLHQEDLATGLRFFLPAAAVDEIVTYGDPIWNDYTVQATLLRGREEAGIEVLASASRGSIFLFRPEHGDGGWYDVNRMGYPYAISTIPWRAYSKDLVSTGQDVLRLLLGAYPGALVLALVLGAFGFVGSAVRRVFVPKVASDPLRPQVEAEVKAAGGRVPTSVALLLAASGLALGAFVATYHLARIPHVQDSVAYLFQAKLFALGKLWAPIPSLPEFFGHEFVVMSDGKWFAKYPPGHPILLALGVLAGAPWLVSPIAAGLSVLVIYLIGRRAYGWPTGLLAAGLALVSPFFTFMSGSYMAHATGLLFVLVFVWLFLRDDRPLTALLCGAALGFGFLIRPWTAGVIAVPFAAVALVGLVRTPREKLARYAAMAAGFVPFVGAWLAYNSALTGDPLKNTMELWWAFDRVGFGPDHGPFGFTLANGLYNASRNLTELQAHLFGWPPYLTLVFVVLPFILLRDRREDRLFLLGFLCLVAGYVAWWADGIMFGPRFYYESLGFLLLLTARGIFECAGLACRALQRWGLRGGAPRTAGGLLAGALLALLVAYNAYYYLPVQWQLYRGYNYVNAGPIRTVEAAGLHDALVFAFVGEPYEWWNYGMVFSSNSPLLDGDVVYARDLGDEQNRRLMAVYPDRVYYRLTGTTLTPLAAQGR